MVIFNNSHVRTFSDEKKLYWTAPSPVFWKERAPHSITRAGRKNLANDSPVLAVPAVHMSLERTLVAVTVVAARDILPH